MSPLETSRPGVLLLALGMLALTILVGIWAARRTRTAACRSIRCPWLFPIG